MDTSQIVRSSAEVVSIVRLHPGDVYKRVESGYSGDASLRFGVVQDTMNNGTDAAVTAIEWKAEYAAVVTEIKVFDGSSPAAIFPATPDEIESFLIDLEKSAQQAVENAERAGENATKQMRRVQILADQLHGLTAPEIAVAPTTDESIQDQADDVPDFMGDTARAEGDQIPHPDSPAGQDF
jgi:hypothetical protein